MVLFDYLKITLLLFFILPSASEGAETGRDFDCSVGFYEPDFFVEMSPVTLQRCIDEGSFEVSDESYDAVDYLIWDAPIDTVSYFFENYFLNPDGVQSRASFVISAISSDRVPVLRVILKNGFDLNYIDKTRNGQPLGEAKSVEMVDFLLSHGADVNLLDYSKNSAVFYQAGEGRFDVLSRILLAGADSNLPGFRGRTAIFQSKNDDITNLLLGHGANLRARDHEGQTAMHVNPSLALVEAGLSVNVRDLSGRSPLHAAMYYPSIENVQFLIEQGADLDAQDEAGETPMFHAVSRGWAEQGFVKQPKRASVVRVLCTEGADPNIPTTREQYLPLHAAAENGWEDVLEELVDCGSDLSARNVAGETAFDILDRVDALKGTEIYWSLNDGKY